MPHGNQKPPSLALRPKLGFVGTNQPQQDQVEEQQQPANMDDLGMLLNYPGTNKPIGGWFQVCRVCYNWTAFTVELDEGQNMPCCKRCQPRYLKAEYERRSRAKLTQQAKRPRTELEQPASMLSTFAPLGRPTLNSTIQQSTSSNSTKATAERLEDEDDQPTSKRAHVEPVPISQNTVTDQDIAVATGMADLVIQWLLGLAGSAAAGQLDGKALEALKLLGGAAVQLASANSILGNTAQVPGGQMAPAAVLGSAGPAAQVSPDIQASVYVQPAQGDGCGRVAKRSRK